MVTWKIQCRASANVADAIVAEAIVQLRMDQQTPLAEDTQEAATESRLPEADSCRGPLCDIFSALTAMFNWNPLCGISS